MKLLPVIGSPTMYNYPGHPSSSSSFFPLSGLWDIFKAILLLPFLGLNRGRRGGKRRGLRQHASWRHIDSWHAGTRIRTEPNRTEPNEPYTRNMEKGWYFDTRAGSGNPDSTGVEGENTLEDNNRRARPDSPVRQGEHIRHGGSITRRAALTRRGERGAITTGGQHQAGGPDSTGWKGSIHDWGTTLAQDSIRPRTGWWETIFGNHSTHSCWYLCLWGMRLTPREPTPLDASLRGHRGTMELVHAGSATHWVFVFQASTLL